MSFSAFDWDSGIPIMDSSTTGRAAIRISAGGLEDWGRWLPGSDTQSDQAPSVTPTEGISAKEKRISETYDLDKIGDSRTSSRHDTTGIVYMETKREPMQRFPVTSAFPNVLQLRRGPHPSRDEGYGSRMRSWYRGTSKLHVRHSTAWASAPSLIQAHEISATPSTGLMVEWIEHTTKDFMLTRFTSTPSLSRKDEGIQDLEELGKEIATRLYMKDNGLSTKHKILMTVSGWVGSGFSGIVLRHNMDFFNFTGSRLDDALRRLCSELDFQAKIGQTDRILAEFSRRFWNSNPIRLYESASVVYAVTNSLFLLNTDLRVAGRPDRTSQSKFVQNTMAAIRAKVDLTAGSSNVPTNPSGTSIAVPKVAGEESKPPITESAKVINDQKWKLAMEELLKDMYTTAEKYISEPHAQHPGSRTRGLLGPSRPTTPKQGSSSLPISSSKAVHHSTTEPSFAPTIGFVSTLSNILSNETRKDEQSFQDLESNPTTDIITDDELALLGAPWQKEGILCYKHFKESAGKRPRSNKWLDVFVVVQRGELSMFTFGEHDRDGSGIVGGGNWLENATTVGTVHLAHSLAHVMPPPGFSKQRPHCMVLTLADDSVYYFQAGTRELVDEWVSTCNYWAARTSAKPLAHDVSGMDYGWKGASDAASSSFPLSVFSNVELLFEADSLSSPLEPRDQSLLEWRGSSRDRTDTLDLHVEQRNRRWRDRVTTSWAFRPPRRRPATINDWVAPRPPLPPKEHSQDERTKLVWLQDYLGSLREDRRDHNALSESMAIEFEPQSADWIKAWSNWEKKLKYLSAEIVKYESYVNSLQTATTLRLKKRNEKATKRILGGDIPDKDPMRLGTI